jgi:hypothetical protein
MNSRTLLVGMLVIWGERLIPVLHKVPWVTDGDILARMSQGVAYAECAFYDGVRTATRNVIAAMSDKLLDLAYANVHGNGVTSPRGLATRYGLLGLPPDSVNAGLILAR